MRGKGTGFSHPPPGDDWHARTGAAAEFGMYKAGIFQTSFFLYPLGFFFTMVAVLPTDHEATRCCLAMWASSFAFLVFMYFLQPTIFFAKKLIDEDYTGKYYAGK